MSTSYPAFLPYRIPISLCVTALLSACATPYSEAPIATNFPTSKQLKLQAGAHWNAIAGNTAETLISSLRLGKDCRAPIPDCTRVYVREPAEPSPFASAFRTSFITALVNAGVGVARNPGNAIQVDFEIQAVKFSPRRPDGTFYSATVIYAGLWGLSGIWEASWASPGAAGVVAVGAFDAYRWMTSELASGPTPQTEIIVTVSASDATQYLGRATNVYYVADSDALLYGVQRPVLYNIAVKGGE